MRCLMLWHGGSDYGHPYPEDAEPFDSLADAVRAFRHRAEGHDRYYPCVEDPTAWILFGPWKTAKEWLNDSASRDPCPDRLLSIGPRGGVVVERG